MSKQNDNGGSKDELKLFLGGLRWDTKEETIKEYFQSTYGGVLNVIIKVDRETNRSRGFGFVEFDDEEAMKRVLRDKDDPGHFIGDRKIDVKIAEPVVTVKKTFSKKIFVGGVPPDMPEETLREYFEQFGEIDEIALVEDKNTRKRRGFVFITYKSEDSVDKICENDFHTVDDTKVEVKKALPRTSEPPSVSKYAPQGAGRGYGYYNYQWQMPDYYPNYPQQNYSSTYYGATAGNYGGYQGGYGRGGGSGGGNYGSYGQGGSGGGHEYSGSGGYRRDEGGHGGSSYRSYGGPVRSNYHQGSATYHPYHR